MSPDNNCTETNTHMKMTDVISRTRARFAAFKNGDFPPSSGKEVVFAVEDTPFTANALEIFGCIVDRAKWDEKTPPYTFILNVLRHIFNGDRVEAILLDYDLGREDGLTGAEIGGWIREVETLLNLSPTKIVANSSDKAGNEAIIEKVKTNVVSSDGNKMAFFAAKAARPPVQVVQPSTRRFFASPAATHDVHPTPKLALG